MASKSTESRRVLPAPLYASELGAAYVGDSLDLLARLDDESVDLVMTSPPFALQRKKAYGNEEQDTYVDWLLNFCHDVRRVLKERPTSVDLQRVEFATLVKGIGVPFIQQAVGYMPIITVLPSGTMLQVNGVVSADRRYVRISPTPFFSGVSSVTTFNLLQGATSTTPGSGTGGTTPGGVPPGGNPNQNAAGS